MFVGSAPPHGHPTLVLPGGISWGVTTGRGGVMARAPTTAAPATATTLGTITSGGRNIEGVVVVLVVVVVVTMQ